MKLLSLVTNKPGRTKHDYSNTRMKLNSKLISLIQFCTFFFQSIFTMGTIVLEDNWCFVTCFFNISCKPARDVIRQQEWASLAFILLKRPGVNNYVLVLSQTILITPANTVIISGSNVSIPGTNLWSICKNVSSIWM